MNIKKILFVVDDKKMGGVSSVLEQIIKSLDKKKFKLSVLVLHNNGDSLNNLKRTNLLYGTPIFDIVDLHLSEIIKSFNIVKLIKKIYIIFLMKTGLIKNLIKKERKKIISENYDIEVCFKDGFSTYFVAYGNSNYKIKWLHADYLNHNPGSKYMRSYGDAVNKYNKIVGISNNVANNFNQIYHKEKSTIVINNLVDTNSLSSIKRIKKEPYTIELVTVGRLHKVKGYDRLLLALKKLNDEGLFENSVLKIVGDGEEKERLKRIVEESNLTKKVIFYGAKKNPWEYLQNGDIFLLTSIAESFALTVIESLSMGIPVLATNYSSASELLENDYNSLIVENSTDGIYNGLKKIICDKNYLKKLKKNSKLYHYDNNKIINQIVNLFGDDEDGK